MNANDIMARYHAKAATNQYIIGFKYKGQIYLDYFDAHDICLWTKAVRASRGNGYAARLRPDYWQKQESIGCGAFWLCTVEDFEKLVAESRYNRGEVFEKLVFELHGQSWTKDSIPFWISGDIDIDGESYQIKFEGATFTNERYLEKIGA